MKPRFKKRRDKIKGTLYLHKYNHLKDNIHWTNYLLNFNVDRLNKKTFTNNRYITTSESLERLFNKLFSKKYED